MNSSNTKKFPWISLLILIATYTVAGWHYAEWSNEMILEGRLWYWEMKPAIAAAIIYGLAVIGILVITNIISTPIKLLTIGLSGWLKLEAKAVMSIFFGALAFALVVQRFQYFVRFLVLLAAFLLFKLDFRTAGYSEITSRIILTFFSLGSFAAGLALFYVWGIDARFPLL
ncbi:MAG: hypothetical protein AAGA80_20785 [Cyanobacteria bacterium P01_F01_bin.143]